MGVTGYVQKILFAYTGENLTFDIRSCLFESLMHKQIAWYDRKDKAPGILSNILSEDITNLNGLTTETVGTIGESFISIFAGVVVSAVFEWRMAIVCIFLTPFMVLGALIMAKIKYRQAPGGKSKNDPNTKIEDPYVESNALLADVILNYRTVISFGEKNIESILERYVNLLEAPRKKKIKNAHIAGCAFGYSLAIRFIYIGVVFYIGA